MNLKTINVLLIAPNDREDLLVFQFDNNPLAVNLNNAQCQSELKEIFVELLNTIIETETELHLTVDSNYSRGLYIEVCEEYISDLNREIKEIRERIKEEE